MSRRVVPLTDTRIKNAKSKSKDYKLADGLGLYLLVSKNGGKWWRLKYRFGNSEKSLSLGVYPDVSLSEARARRDEARRQLSDGHDPSNIRKQDKKIAEINQNDTFKELALDWLDRLKGQITEPYRLKKIASLENDVFPFIGSKRIRDIAAIEFLEVIKRIQSRGVIETSHRVFSLCSNVWSYAVTLGKADRNITSDIDKRYSLIPASDRNFPTITNEKDIASLLQNIDNYTGDFRVKFALKFAIFTAQRPFNIRSIEWSEVDFQKSIWRIPAEKMKMKTEHIVYLSSQALSVLNQVRPCTLDGKYVFPSVKTRSQPLSDNALNGALRRMGYSKNEIVTHGFRAMFSTLCHEHGHRTEVIEACLSHAERNKVKAAYNHAKYIKERKELMQWYSDFLSSISGDIFI